MGDKAYGHQPSIRDPLVIRRRTIESGSKRGYKKDDRKKGSERYWRIEAPPRANTHLIQIGLDLEDSSNSPLSLEYRNRYYAS